MEWVAQNTQYLSNWNPVVATEEDLLKKAKEVMVLESMNKKQLGVLYEDRLKKTYEERLASISNYYTGNPPAKQSIDANGSSLSISIERTFGRYMV